MAKIKALQERPPVEKPPVVVPPPVEDVEQIVDEFIKFDDPHPPALKTNVPEVDNRPVTGQRLEVIDGKLVNTPIYAEPARPVQHMTEKMVSKLEAEQAAGRAALAKHAERAAHYMKPVEAPTMTPVYRPTSHFVAQKDPETGKTIRFAPPNKPSRTEG